MSSLETINQAKQDLSSKFEYKTNEVAIILAAGHGKRIKSHRSKMLHEIWGMTTVERVYRACASAIPDINSVIVVGIKAVDVMEVIGKNPNTAYAYQEEQKGTGHAVQIGLAEIDKDFDGIVYVFPGDMGLIDKDTIAQFRENFISQKSDMMVLTGVYEGPNEENSYGRIIRVPEQDITGTPSGSDFQNVIEIIEHKDILALAANVPYTTSYKGKIYGFMREDLLWIKEYNSGVYAFDSKKLHKLIFEISSQNAQKEIYITDLIGLFNKEGYIVGAASPKEEYVVMGFNDKTVLKEMDAIFREKIYENLKNIIEIDDADDFFIDEQIVEQILEMDKQGTPLDIHVGKGAYIGKGVKLNYNCVIKRNAHISGSITLGKNVVVGENVSVSCFPEQSMSFGENVQILAGVQIKGNVSIGKYSRVESSVHITGSDEHPVRIGKNVIIKGTTYLFGSSTEDDVYIEHCVLINKHVNKIVKKDGTVQQIRFYLPLPEGIDAVEHRE